MSGLGRKFKREQQKKRYKKFCEDWDLQLAKLRRTPLVKLSQEELTILKAMETRGRPPFAEFLRRLEVGKKLQAEAERVHTKKLIEGRAVHETWDELVASDG